MCQEDLWSRPGELEDAWAAIDSAGQSASGLADTDSSKDEVTAPTTELMEKVFVPTMHDIHEVKARQAKMHARYEKANKYFMKIKKKSYQASNAKQRKLNKKAEQARKRMIAAKEKMQKQYANDDPEDAGKTKNDRIDGAGPDTGSWGSSGTPGDRKWYSDGVTTDQASLNKKNGKYFLGRRRRRIGAGFGRRRAAPQGKMGPKAVAAAVKGHNLLREGISVTVKAKAAKGKKAQAQQAVASYSKKTSKGKVRGKEANTRILSPQEKEALKASGAGLKAQVDKTAHFTKATEARIVGKKEANYLRKAEVTSLWSDEEEGALEESEKMASDMELDQTIEDLHLF